MSSTKNTATEIAKALFSEGWVERKKKGKHYILYCPCGEHILTMPRTPHGGHRTTKNLRAQVRRLGCPNTPVKYA